MVTGTSIGKYKKIKLPDGSTRDEHRLIIERELGRKLTRNELVHHKNLNKGDNHRGNLGVRSRSDHGRHHRKLQAREHCSVLGCPLPHRAKGYCRKHYERVVRTGNVNGLRGHSSTNPHCIP